MLLSQTWRALYINVVTVEEKTAVIGTLVKTLQKYNLNKKYLMYEVFYLFMLSFEPISEVAA